MDEALAQGRSYSIDLEMIRPDGTRRWVVATGEPEHASNGVVIGLRGTVQDVTDRKREELARLHSEERFRAFFQSSAVGAVRADAKTGRVSRSQRNLLPDDRLHPGRIASHGRSWKSPTRRIATIPCVAWSRRGIRKFQPTRPRSGM